MVFTDINATTLVAWFTTCIVFIFSSLLFMSKKFQQYYMKIKASGEISWAPSVGWFSFCWTATVALKITSTTLWTMNYSLCTNTYFIVFVSLTLAELASLASWGPLFIKWGKPEAAFRMVFFAMLCAITNTVLMAISVTLDPTTVNPQDACIANKTSGILAVVLYAVPILGYMIACYLLWQWKDLPKDAQYCHWKKTYKPSSTNKSMKDSNYYSMDAELLPVTQKKKSVVK
jgi:hypothetical protein